MQRCLLLDLAPAAQKLAQCLAIKYAWVRPMRRTLLSTVIVCYVALCACGAKSGTSLRNGRLEATAVGETCCLGGTTTRAPTAQEQADIDRSADSLEQVV